LTAKATFPDFRHNVMGQIAMICPSHENAAERKLGGAKSQAG